ncbi:MAG: ATP-binding cassette domain-containing protein [Pleurocapsa minor GSE-CHR-MK-17-07R]|jgi:simple sugar transport system ATP-binding protein|nr:ATP-binding cassette domain-containing protein [Pleurocapsa minor GSE-CHR-MK 17-07R]
MNDKATTPLVEMKGIVKQFGTVEALRGVDFRVDRQEIVGLLGDNGAGKSTLIKILTGMHTPTRGQIYFEGKPVFINSPHDARDIGIETVYQDLALVPLMSIARNFWLGQELTRGFGPFKTLNHKAMAEQAREALLDIGIRIRNAEEAVAMMSGGERQSIAIGRAVYFGKKLLILDEPTSALSVKQTGEVLNYTRRAKERGMSVIFITHNIAHVHEVADRFTIIRGGRKIGDFYKHEVTEMEVAQMVMSGAVPDRLKLPDVVEE